MGPHIHVGPNYYHGSGYDKDDGNTCAYLYDKFSEKLDSALKGRQLSGKINLIIYTESAVGLLNLPDICKMGVSLSDKGSFQLDGIVFGSDDFCADIGTLM